jgi:putative flavoprotein involved in K+ transport
VGAVEFAIIGGSQSGLAIAFCLKMRGLSCAVLDRAEEIGAAWRARYDSLRLFTPAQYSNLPGMRFPAPRDHYPTKDEVAEYLKAYAARFALDVRLRQDVRRLTREADGFRIATTGENVLAKNVIVATGQSARVVPGFANAIDPAIFQMHSADYRNSGHLPAGSLLVVGAGNSGAQIAEELSRERQVAFSVGRMPRRFPQRFLGRDIFWWLTLAGMMDIKRSRRNDIDAEPMPLIGSNLASLIRARRIERLPRVVGADGRALAFEGGQRRAFDAVIWATGFRSDFAWVSIQGALDARGEPVHERGVSPITGLYWIGLPWLHTKGSGFLGFVGRDAEFLAKTISRRRRRWFS